VYDTPRADVTLAQVRSQYYQHVNE
jgi:hypothetical protein